MLIMFVALLLFGGEKLPQLARGLGKGIRDFKDASEGVKREISNQIDSYEKKAEPKPAEEVAVTHTDEAPVTAEHLKETAIPGTIAASESHVATDQIDLTPEHLIAEKSADEMENHTGTAHVSTEPVKEQHS